MELTFCRIDTVEPILKNPKKEFDQESNPIKAYKLTVFNGQKNLTVVSAIVDLFKPEDLLGKVTTFQTDLPPAQIRGFISEAMIYLKEEENERPRLVSVDEICIGICGKIKSEA